MPDNPNLPDIKFQFRSGSAEHDGTSRVDYRDGLPHPPEDNHSTAFEIADASQEDIDLVLADGAAFNRVFRLVTHKAVPGNPLSDALLQQLGGGRDLVVRVSDK